MADLDLDLLVDLLDLVHEKRRGRRIQRRRIAERTERMWRKEKRERRIKEGREDGTAGAEVGAGREEVNRGEKGTPIIICLFPHFTLMNNNRLLYV